MITILLVDDDQSVCHAITRLLRLTGHRVISTTSGQEALTILDREVIDLVLCDVQMPGISGQDISRKLSESYPVVLMSGSLHEQTEGVLAKPFTPDELLSHISKALQLAA